MKYFETWDLKKTSYSEKQSEVYHALPHDSTTTLDVGPSHLHGTVTSAHNLCLQRLHSSVRHQQAHVMGQSPDVKANMLR